MIIKYSLLYKNGVKEEFVVEDSAENLAKVENIFREGFENDLNGIVEAGKRGGSIRYIRVSDVSQVDIKVLPERNPEIIDSN